MLRRLAVACVLAALARAVDGQRTLGDRGPVECRMNEVFDDALVPTCTAFILQFDKLSIEQIEKLIDSTREHKNLRTVMLRSNGFVEELAHKFFDALSTVADGLLGIGFRENDLGPRAALALSHALKGQQSLSRLDIRGNPLGDDGIDAIVAGIRGSESLLHLNVANTKFGPRGAKLIAHLLDSNTSPPLKNLDVRFNAIGDEGAFALADMIEFHDTLEVLMYNDPSIGPEGRRALKRAAEAHGSVRVADSPRALKEEL